MGARDIHDRNDTTPGRLGDLRTHRRHPAAVPYGRRPPRTSRTAPSAPMCGTPWKRSAICSARCPDHSACPPTWRGASTRRSPPKRCSTPLPPTTPRVKRRMFHVKHAAGPSGPTPDPARGHAGPYVPPTDRPAGAAAPPPAPAAPPRRAVAARPCSARSLGAAAVGAGIFFVQAARRPTRPQGRRHHVPSSLSARWHRLRLGLDSKGAVQSLLAQPGRTSAPRAPRRSSRRQRRTELQQRELLGRSAVGRRVPPVSRRAPDAPPRPPWLPRRARTRGPRRISSSCPTRRPRQRGGVHR